MNIPADQRSPYPGGQHVAEDGALIPRQVSPVRRQGDRGSGDEPSPTRYLTGPQVQKRYGITDVSLWRWLHDPKSKIKNFPPPALVVNRRRYWREDELIGWERSRARAEAAA